MSPDVRLRLSVSLLGGHQGGEGQAAVQLQGRAQQEGVQVLPAWGGKQTFIRLKEKVRFG